MPATVTESNALGQPVGLEVPQWSGAPYPSREPMQGRYVRLEPLDANVHAEPLFAANQLDSAGRSWTYLPYGPFEEFAAYRDWMQRACSGDDPLYFAIIDLETGTAVGVASYLDIAPDDGSIEVGHLNFSPRMQRTRGSTEAMYLMMSRAFESGYRRYQWRCHALNAASCAAAQRLGLSYEGVFRNAKVMKGRNRDTAWFAAIDNEWPALRAAFEIWLNPENFDSQVRQRQRLSELTAPILKSVGPRMDGR